MAARGAALRAADPLPRPVRSSFLASPERPAEAHFEADVAVEPHAVDLDAYALDQLCRGLELVDLEDQVPRPGGRRHRPDLKQVVAERRDDAGPELLPFCEKRAEARKEDIALLLLGRLEVRREPAAEHEDAVGPGHRRTVPLHAMSVSVVGAGISGLSIAHHLLERGLGPVTVYERVGIGCGASGIQPGGVRRQWGTRANCL